MSNTSAEFDVAWRDRLQFLPPCDAIRDPQQLKFAKEVSNGVFEHMNKEAESKNKLSDTAAAVHEEELETLRAQHAESIRILNEKHATERSKVLAELARLTK